MMENTCTLLTIMTSLQLCALARTGTGCVLPMDHGSRSGILKARKWLKNLNHEVVSLTSKAEPPQCLSLAWSTDGQTLFAGYSDNTIRVWQVSISSR